MDIPLDEVVYFDVCTHNPATGAVSDADSTPTFAVYEEATDTDIGVGGNLTKRTSLTGNYRGSFTQSSANGFEVGKFYNVIASATVNSIAGKKVVLTFRCVAAENVAGVPQADVVAIGGATQSATDLKDFADAGYDPSSNEVNAHVTSYAKGMAPHAFATTIGSVTNQTTFVIADGPPNNDSVNTWRVLFIDSSDAHQVSARYVVDFATSGKILTIDSAPEFTIASGDTIVFYPFHTSVVPTVTNLTNLPAIPNNWLTAAGINSGAFTSAKFAAGAFDAVWTVSSRTLTSISGLGIALAEKLTKYFQLALRKDSAITTDNATELGEINADGGSGGGSFANTSDAQEAIRDRGDAAWATATGFSTHSAADAATAVRSELSVELARIDEDISSRGTADPGDAMDLVNSPNATAVAAIQSGLATGTALQTVDDEIATLQASVNDVPTNAEFEARSLAAASYATSTAQTTAQADLDILTGTDGATLATSQPNYAPAKAGDQMALVDDAITAGKFDQSTAHPVASADAGSTAIARTGADGDTLETLSDEIAGISAGGASAEDVRIEMDANSTKLALITSERMGALTDWIDGGRLDLILDAIAANVVSILDDTGTDGVALSAALCNKIADHVRRRTQANVEASEDGDTLSLGSEYGFIQQAQESSVSGGTMTVYKTDGTTPLGTKTVTTDADAEPVVGVN